jgi:hypothetical protein
VAAVCVFCASSTAIEASYVDLAAEVGAGLAARGHSLVSGGGRISAMGAVARAVRAGGGRTVGVIPRVLVDLEVADDDCDELVVTDDMRARKGEMDRRADAFLTLPGGIGTLEELFEVWVAATLGIHGKPVVVLDPGGLYAPLRAQLDLLVEQRFVRREAYDAIAWTTTVDAALDEVERRLGAGRRRPSAEELLEAEP